VSDAEALPIDWGAAIAGSQNPFLTAITRYARAPVAFVREVLHAEPDNWQLEALRAVARGHTRIAIRSGHGVGKAMTISNSVDTPDGCRRWGDLRPGDRLFGRDGEATHIVARHDQGVRAIYRVTFDDGTSCRVDGEHLWTVRGRAQRRVDNKRSHRRGVGRTEQPSEYAADFINITTADIIRRGVKRANGAALARQWELPVHGAVQYPARDVPLAPYLLGALLGDGSLRRTTPLLTTAEATVAHWQAAADAAGVRTTQYTSPGRTAVALSLLGIAGALRDLGVADCLSAHKSVPRRYLENSQSVRLAVLQGLMDTDGYIDDRGIAVFTSVSKQLAVDVAWLVRSLGGKAFMGDARSSHYYKDDERIRVQDHYDVTVRMPVGLDLFTLPQKTKRMRPCQPRYLARWIESIEPDGEEEAMCVTVDAADGLYLANDFIVTHNTAYAAWLICWFVNTRVPFKVAVTAPSSSQLFDVLWPELLKWFQKLPPGWAGLWDYTSDHITLKGDAECFVTARTSRSDKPEAMSGIHSTHVLLVADEASGIDEAVYQAAGGSMSTPGAITVLIGNPTRSSGTFYAAHMLERDRWFTMRVSSADSPRVTRGYVEELAQRYGMDSNAYRVRVQGEFPAADSDTLIAASLVDDAMARDVDIDPDAPCIWGVDVARFGSDASVLIKRKGNVVIEMPRRWRQVDTMMLAGAIKAEYDAAGPYKPALICIDVIGIGAGVVDRLHEQNLPILGINVAEAASTSGRFGRLRDELWCRCKDWLETRAVRLPRDEQLRDDLVAPKYAFLSDGRMQIESKNLMRARGLASPDAADALNLTFAEQGLGIASGMTSGLHDSMPIRMVLSSGDLV